MGNKRRRVLIAGAGPAGMMAAAAAARNGAEVTLLEGMPKPGKKLLLSGNGRCNLTNLSPQIISAYGSSSENAETEKFVGDVFRVFGVSETLNFFQQLGISMTDKAGWVYPASGQAQSVLHCLLREMSHLGVKVKYNTKVDGIRRDNDGYWKVKCGGWEYTGDAVILACGSKAAPSTGSDGSGYRLAEMCGINIVSPEPVLTGFMTDDRNTAAAAGARTRGAISLFDSSGNLLASERGEIQWADYGISGIAVFQLSRFLRNAKKAKRKTDVFAEINFVPELSAEEIIERMENTYAYFGGKCGIRDLLEGYTHERVAAMIATRINAAKPAEKADVSGNAPGSAGADSSVNEKLLIAAAAKALKAFRIHITGTRSFENAQTSSGGVSLDQLVPGKLEAQNQPGLFFAGEIIDIDGPCGGYNLQWAWSSGYTAGLMAACPDPGTYISE